MKERTRHIAIGGIATALGGALFAFLLYKAGPSAIWHSVQSFGLLSFCGFLAISLLNFGLYAFRWKIILQEIEQKPVRYVRLFLHRMSGFATGYLTPGAQVAGEPVRVALLATEGISTKTATSSVILDLAFEISAFVVYVVLGMALAFTAGAGKGTFGPFAYIALGVLVVGMAIFFISIAKGWNIFQKLLKKAFIVRHKRLFAFCEWLSGVEKMMTQFFAGRTRILIVVILLSAVMTGFRAVEILYIGWGFGEEISLSSAILLSTIPGLVLLAPVPGGLGLFEASTAAMLTALSIPIPAIALAFVIRLRDFTFILIGAFHGLREGAGWMGRSK
jgi:uncharacterized protein (TIRG00374 family)